MIKINLLPRERVRRPVIAPRLLVLVVAGGVIAGVTVSTFYLNTRNALIRNKITQVNVQIEALRPKIARVEELGKQIEAARRKEQLLKRLEAARVPWMAVLEELRAVLPTDVWLNQIAAGDEGDLVFSGYGMTYEAVARFMVNLEASKMFEGVDLSIGQKLNVAGREVVNFSVTGRLSSVRKEAVIR